MATTTPVHAKLRGEIHMYIVLHVRSVRIKLNQQLCPLTHVEPPPPLVYNQFRMRAPLRF